MTVIRDGEEVTIEYLGTATIAAHSSGRAKRNWPNSARVREGVDRYRIEWWPDSLVGPYTEEVHGRIIGCPECRFNSRAVFRGYPDEPHYECLVCGHTNEFDPEQLHSMSRSSFGEVIETETDS